MGSLKAEQNFICPKGKGLQPEGGTECDVCGKSEGSHRMVAAREGWAE